MGEIGGLTLTICLCAHFDCGPRKRTAKMIFKKVLLKIASNLKIQDLPGRQCEEPVG